MYIKNRIFVFVITVFPWSIYAEVQNIELDFSPQPNREIRVINSSTSELILDVKGDDELIEMNRKRGVIFPVEITQSKTIKTRTITGPLEPGGAFSYVQHVEDVTSFTEDKDGNRVNMTDSTKLMVGLTVYGRMNGDKSLDVEMVEGKDLDPSQRIIVENAFKALAGAMTSPKKDMAVGDHYNWDVAFDMPIPGRSPIKVISDSKYTLKEIKDGKAYFIVSSTFTIPEKPEGVTFKASGSGDGNVIYDIRNKIQEKFSTDLNMKIEISSGELFLSSTIDALSTIQTILVK